MSNVVVRNGVAFADTVTASGNYQVDEVRGRIYIEDGATIDGEHGAMAWQEVNTPDAAASCRFYGDLFGLTAHKMEGADYYILQRGEDMICGVLQMDENWAGIPPHWMGYFAIDNTDAALERVVAAGGKVQVPAFDMAYGRMAVIADPYGANISIVQLPAA